MFDCRKKCNNLDLESQPHRLMHTYSHYSYCN